MVVDVQIFSKEMIKPSSPTPHHLRNHNLSWLDQVISPVHIPLIFFYNADQLVMHNCNRDQVSKYLKTSLSHTLKMFYPFAGKFMDNRYVECNDDGVEFIVARAHTHLSRVVENADMEELKQFLPCDPYGSNRKKFILSIQVNYLDCGGVCIGVCISHKTADASSLVTFLRLWAAKCIGAENINIKEPNFDLGLHFPAKESLSGVDASRGFTKTIAKKFVFDKEMIASLRNAFSGSEVKNPTRVEAVSTFIWMFFKKIANSRNKKSAIVHAVNLRQKMNSIYSCSNSMGNFVACSLAIAGFEEYCSQDLVGLLRKSISRFDCENTENVANTIIEDYLDSIERSQEVWRTGDTEFCIFSSWCRFPVYELDFGWGSPVWMCTINLPIQNTVNLMRTSSGDGIEAWINLIADDMEKLDLEKEFISLFPSTVIESP